MFVNKEEFIFNIDNLVNIYLSDHNTIITRVDFKSLDPDRDLKISFCETVIHEYDFMNGSDDKWLRAKEWINAIDFNNPTKDDLLKELENMVCNVFDKKQSFAKTSKGNNFRSNNRIPREVRRLFKRKASFSKKLSHVKTKDRCKILTKKLLDTEKEIRNNQYKRKCKLEQEAFGKMQDNPKYFYSYTKKLRG